MVVFRDDGVKGEFGGRNVIYALLVLQLAVDHGARRHNSFALSIYTIHPHTRLPIQSRAAVATTHARWTDTSRSTNQWRGMVWIGRGDKMECADMVTYIVS